MKKMWKVRKKWEKETREVMRELQWSWMAIALEVDSWDKLDIKFFKAGGWITSDEWITDRGWHDKQCSLKIWSSKQGV